MTNPSNNSTQSESPIFSTFDLIFLTIATFIAGWIIKLPKLFQWEQDQFIAKNIGFIVFPALIFYFSWKRSIPLKRTILPLVVVILAILYANSLPFNETSDSLILTWIHLPIFIWTLVGFAFSSNAVQNSSQRVGFLRFNGDLIVMLAVMQLAASLFTIITLGLYELIGINIKDFYIDYVVNWGLPAIPLLATILVVNNPQLVGKVSPIIAKIFTPFVLISLAIFLGAVIATGKDPYNDRQFLLIFNALLIGVMAIILFSLSEATKTRQNKFQLIMLLALSLLTIMDNGIAISAIVFRLAEYGITPNRLAVLGSNVLMFMNLIGIAYQLINVVKGKTDTESVEKVIAQFLPLYAIWCALVAFGFPLLFGFK